MEKTKLLDDLKKIEGWFPASVFYSESAPDSDKVTVLEILLHEYAEDGLLLTHLIEGEWHFMHPDTYTRLARNYEIDRILKEDNEELLDSTEGTLPLPSVTVLGMIDARQLNLSQLKQKLEIEKEEGIKKWLKLHGIPLHSKGREKVVYEFSVDLAMQIELVEDLKRQYPTKWHKIYAANSSCDRMTNAVFEVYPPISAVSESNRSKTPKRYLK